VNQQTLLSYVPPDVAMNVANDLDNRAGQEAASALRNEKNQVFPWRLILVSIA
jgi:hypothetical protein